MAPGGKTGGIALGAVILIIILGALAFHGLSFSTTNNTTQQFLSSEGNFSSWAKQWNVTYDTSNCCSFEGFLVDEPSLTILAVYNFQVQSFSLIDGHSVANLTLDMPVNQASNSVFPMSTVNHVYTVFTDDATDHHLMVVKNGVIIFDSGALITTGYVQYASISDQGQYIVVWCFTSGAGAGRMMAFKGS